MSAQELVVFTWNCGGAHAAGIGMNVQPEAYNHVRYLLKEKGVTKTLRFSEGMGPKG